MNQKDQVRKGLEAERLLTDPLLQEAISTAVESAKDAWIAAQTVEERERCWMRVWALNAVTDQLRAIVDDALVTQYRLGQKGSTN